MCIRDRVQHAGLVRGLLYEDAAPEIDLSYTACGFDVKEAIVVKAPQAAYRYAFRLTLDGLTPKLSDGAVLLSNAAGEVIYVIPAPYLEDAAGATSDAAAYTLSPQADGSYLLTVTADEAWMNDDSRAWPIQIDPTVELRSDNYVRGTYIRSAQPTAKAGDRSTLFAGYLTTAGQQELCVQMVLPALPKNATLVSALLSVDHVGLFTKTYANAPTGSKLQLYAYALNGLVGDAAQMTWNDVYGSGGYGRAQDPLDYRTLSTSTRGQYISWDITRAVLTQYDKNDPKQLFAAITLAAKDGANEMCIRDRASAMRQRLAADRERFAKRAAALDAMSPLKVLGRGYALVKNGQKLVKSTNDAKPGDRLTLQLSDGTLPAIVARLTEEAQ